LGDFAGIKLHHNAYRCRDSEETRVFYEDFLGLRLAGTLEIKDTKSGQATHVLHTFYELDDHSYLAFFEAPDLPFEFKQQHDYDLHIALEVDAPALQSMMAKGKERGIETRGISDHKFIQWLTVRSWIKTPSG
jgi:catechol 2,3-dioxygenase-like lactoylglutathione lyase family enzyme